MLKIVKVELNMLESMQGNQKKDVLLQTCF